MEPTRELVDAIYHEKVLRARRMTPQRRIEVGAQLSDMGRQMMREAIRRQNPAAIRRGDSPGNAAPIQTVSQIGRHSAA